MVGPRPYLMQFLCLQKLQQWTCIISPSHASTVGYGENLQSDAPNGGGRSGPNVMSNVEIQSDNSRIYISNLPPDVTIEELQELFGSIGQVARIKQTRSFWPLCWRFFNNYDFRGYKISVAMAEKSAPRRLLHMVLVVYLVEQPVVLPPNPLSFWGSRSKYLASGQGGGRGSYGGDRRRGNYGSGPTETIMVEMRSASY
ncbi:hypothetical protein HAX54_007561 [Datura stramonium]|uniref:RRM domain-containing protein n=1 Tax=Datura stramonium TaxID=4076 RepID=A0ABS8TCX9_DATST|nr:hypothetical protein [Datura stramonium]